jgi:hypothetical protein
MMSVSLASDKAAIRAILIVSRKRGGVKRVGGQQKRFQISSGQWPGSST